MPPTRRTRSQRTNRNKNNKNKKKNKKTSSARTKKSNKNKHASDSEQSEESESEQHSESDNSDSDDTDNGTHHNAEDVESEQSESEIIPKQQKKKSKKKRKNDIECDILSPHRRQKVDDLPNKINAMQVSTENHSKLMQSLFADNENNDNLQNQDSLKKIYKILKEGDILKKSQCDITKAINDEFNELCKNREVSRDELNKNIEAINAKHSNLKKRFDENMKNITKQIEAMNDKQNNEKKENEEDESYKILYETSMKKIKMLNEDLTDLKAENQSQKECIIQLKKERENQRIESENAHKKECDAIANKYKLEVNELEIKLKCTSDEYMEFKTKMDEKIKIEGNNKDLMIENLKRENEALCNELSAYRQNANTLSPNSALLSPAVVTKKVQNYADYTKHVRDSPLNERTQNALLSISNVKNLENEIKNLKEEVVSYKNQLFAKKELIKEFENLLQQNQIQQKEILCDHQNISKTINLYRILTGTKIERKMSEEMNGDKTEQQYLCRTAHKETDSMMEYFLTLDLVNEHAESFCDYRLISSHNLIKPLNESLSQNITFYTKDAPLFLKGLIQQMFMTKTQ